MSDKLFFGYLSILFALIAGGPYLCSVRSGKTKPHIFTFIIWSLSTGIASAGQFADHAGPGAWATATAACFCVLIAVFSYKYGEKSITRADWAAFWIALSALPAWYLTKSPLLAVSIATFIDAVAYVPTFRKSFAKPNEEKILLYVMSNAYYLASVAASENYSFTTLLYPACMFVFNAALIMMLATQRAKLK